jgi:uncharacterized protein YkwD
MLKPLSQALLLSFFLAGVGCGDGAQQLLETGSIDRGAPISPNSTPPPADGDRAPAGTFEKPIPGALSDRDYSATILMAEQALAAINKYRETANLGPLKLDAQLSKAATRHSEDLAKWDRISHHGSDGSNPWDRVKASGYPARLAAENVGTGQVTFAEVLRGWKDSPGHNKNLLLSDAQDAGIALVVDRNSEFKTFWTLVVGTRM